MAPPSQTVIYEEDAKRVGEVVARLQADTFATAVFVIDREGQVYGSAGDTRDMDVTSLATLAAGNIAATGVIAEILNEREFTTQYHEGERSNLHLQVVGGRVILLVVFDSRSSLGLVRLRARRAASDLLDWIQTLADRPEPESGGIPEITDADIDRLFND